MMQRKRTEEPVSTTLEIRPDTAAVWRRYGPDKEILGRALRQFDTSGTARRQFRLLRKTHEGNDLILSRFAEWRGRTPLV